MTGEDRISCEQSEAWIEERARGKLGRDESTRLARHVALCPECAARMDDAVAVHALFHELGRPVCPESVVRRVLAAADAGEPEPAGTPLAIRVAHLGARLRRGFEGLGVRAWGPAAAAVAILALVLLWSRLGPDLRGRPARETPGAAAGSASGAEIERAAQETRLALAILVNALHRTAHVVGDEVGTQLGSPVLEGVELGLGAIGIRRATRPHRGVGTEPETERPDRRRERLDARTGDPLAIDRERNWT